MTDPVEQKEWAEGLRLAEIIVSVATDAPPGVERRLAAAVISLAGEVERLTRLTEGDPTSIYHEAARYRSALQEIIEFGGGIDWIGCREIAAAALSPLPSERKGP